jgi:hypothetical protein
MRQNLLFAAACTAVAGPVAILGLGSLLAAALAMSAASRSTHSGPAGCRRSRDGTLKRKPAPCRGDAALRNDEREPHRAALHTSPRRPRRGRKAVI